MRYHFLGYADIRVLFAPNTSFVRHHIEQYHVQHVPDVKIFFALNIQGGIES